MEADNKGNIRETVAVRNSLFLLFFNLNYICMALLIKEIRRVKMKLLIWGIGQLAWTTVKNISETNIVGYIDTYSTNKEFAGKPLYKPSEVKCLEYDAILVTTVYAKEIAQICREMEISLDKVIFVYGNVETTDINQDYEFITKICGREFSTLIKNRYHLIREILINLGTDKKKFEVADYSDKKICQNDYVRVKTLELLVDEIKERNIKGEIAELGVFRGDFAQLLNLAFPDRKLYLFDTFEGFDEDELARELDGNVRLAVDDAYKNTSIQVVMDKMQCKEQIVVKKGFFPNSLEGLEQQFAFVSLDCDWEESLYQGLIYFYPRLEWGGYIMIHDYNNHLGCAKKAIRRYEKETNSILPKVPVCDAQG